MLVAVLLSDPKQPHLDDALAAQVQRDLGGAGREWLAPGSAAQITLELRPDDLAQHWAALQKQQIDLVIVPAAQRRKKLLIADMDSTMIQQECIDELAAEAGVGAQVAAITREAMDGALDFDEALQARVALLRGLPASIVQDVVRRRITLMPGGPALLATMKANGAYTALISGGFTAFTAHIAASLGFDTHQANHLDVSDGRLSGTVSTPILGKQAKLDALHTLAARLGLTLDQTLAVGDGANDLAMLSHAGFGVALHAKPSVQAVCDMRVNFADLTALLYLQGYHRDEFCQS